MDTLIPELDRICPECGAPYLQCASTTADTWLGHCPSCGWQGWQHLPPAPQLPANQSRPPAKSPPIEFRHDPKRVPILHRISPERANKNLPSGETFPNRPAPNPAVLAGGKALRGYGYCGAGAQRPRPWPRWLGVVAPIALTAALLAVVLLQVLNPGAITNFEPFPESSGHWEGPSPSMTHCSWWDGKYICEEAESSP